MLRVSDQKMMKSKREGKRRSSPSSGKIGVKVVYISSPMKVRTSASEFRAIVQELTGRDSDVARFMESTNEADQHDRTEIDRSHLNTTHEETKDQSLCCGTTNNIFPADYSNYSFENESPTGSDSFVERFDGNLFSMPHVERSFRENNFPFVFQESTMLDVLN